MPSLYVTDLFASLLPDTSLPRRPSILLSAQLLLPTLLANVVGVLQLLLVAVAVAEAADTLLLGLGHALLAHVVVVAVLVGRLGRLLLLVLVPRAAAYDGVPSTTTVVVLVAVAV